MRSVEFKTEIMVPVRVCAFCPECGTELVPTGSALLSSPPQHPHECQYCRDVYGKREREYTFDLDDVYPRIEFRKAADL